ncbi:MAG: GNAT family N-acetyltransferase [Alphaproteobacteria bacterium]|jgi:ribosomal protein S18 acetylase RimI-like enzyme|nr:GNAT family N-acetyltransferase [Alphaproteobacteria bacterium]
MKNEVVVTFSFTNKIKKQTTELLETEYAKYESLKGVSCNFEQFSIVAKKDSNIIGVLTGYTAFSEIYIDDLLVLPNYRCKGIGKKLLTYVEQHFRGLGFTNINLVTNEFQAPEFYKKCGYTLEFIRKNSKFPKFTKYFFIKWLDAKYQLQLT